MLIARLRTSSRIAVKLAAKHGITAEEVVQIPANGPVFVPNPRRSASLLMIGPTDGGRLLTVVIDPDPTDDGTWHVTTAWDASPAQHTTYTRRRR